MKILLEQNESLKDIEVFIRYARMNNRIKHLEAVLKSLDKTIKCSIGDEEIWIPVCDIYYIESVDKKTFIYCQDSVYQCALRLYQLLDELMESGFVKVSKSCILNIHVLERIRPLINSRMEAFLSNGEKIYITRKYVASIKERLLER